MHVALDYIVVVSWASLLLVACFGYGSCLSRALSIGHSPPAGVGLELAWGVAVVLAIGGWLVAFSLADRPVLIGLGLVGVALAVALSWERLASGRAAPRGGLARYAWLTAPALLAALWLLSSIAPAAAFNTNDDTVAYLPYITRILENGDLIEPFGFRRLTAFGGQSLLQAWVVAFGSELHANVADMGLAPVLLVALFAGLARPVGTGPKACAAVAVTVALLLPVPRANTASVATGAVLLLALLSTLERRAREEDDAGPLAFLAGLTAAGAGALRPTFLAAGVLALAFFHASRLPRGGRPALREAALSLLGGILGLAPWMLALVRSSRTPLFPLIPGNYQPSFATLSADLGPAAFAAHAARVLVHPSFLVMWLPLLAIAGLRRRGPILSLAGACGVAAVLTIQANGVWPLQNHHRHVWPLLFAASFGTLALTIRQWSAAGRPGRARAAVLLAALLFVPALQRDLGEGLRRVRDGFVSLPDQWRARQPLRLTLEASAYAEAQGRVPRGSLLLTVVDRPFLLDYERHAIRNVDAIGAASPPPGMPFFQGPDALRAYLLGQSIEWLLARDFDRGSGLYSRSFWREEHAFRVLNDVWRPHFLDFMDNVDAIARCDGVVTAPMGIRLIRLVPGGGCAPDPRRGPGTVR